MQAPKEAPPDMQLKDKFLVQSTVVPYGTTEEDIMPSFVSIHYSFSFEYVVCYVCFDILLFGSTVL